MSRRIAGNGFTLAEALAAMVLVAVVTPAVMRAVSLCTRTGGVATDRLLAMQLAQSKIDELVAIGDFAQTQLEGNMAIAASGATLSDWQTQTMERFDWQATFEPWTDPTFDVLTVRVEWQRRGSTFDVALSTLVATTTEAAP